MPSKRRTQRMLRWDFREPPRKDSVSHDRTKTILVGKKPWGAEVRSEDGTAAAPVRKRAGLFCLACSALSLPAVEKDLLRRLARNLVFPFMHRRDCM